MITQKIRTMMSEVDRHISKKERLKAMTKIEDIVEEFNKVKQEQMTEQWPISHIIGPPKYVANKTQHAEYDFDKQKNFFPIVRLIPPYYKYLTSSI